MKPGIIVHHWDVDGICSAALLLKHKYPDFLNWTPNRGIRRLDRDHIEWLIDFEEVIIVDMSLPHENIEAITETNKVTIIDHHVQEKPEKTHFINPVAQEKDPAFYPSTTWVIKEELGVSISPLVLLGVVGDMERKTLSLPIWGQMKEFLDQTGGSFDEYFRWSKVLDSLYKAGDIDAVMDAPRLLIEEDLSLIDSYKQWIRINRHVEDEFNKYINEEHAEIGGFLLIEMDTDLNLVSSVAKAVSWGRNRDVIAVNRGFFHDVDQIYVRSSRIDTDRVHEDNLAKGWFSTGKKDVVGAVVPKNETDSYIKSIVSQVD